MLDAAIIGAVLASVVAAATTLLLASLGELVAERAGTNGYEVLTSLGRRYRRVYRGA